jgi:Na+/H+ antiporter NhaD/arsenite permease-like protein
MMFFAANALNLPAAAAVPFALLLALVAILPLAAGHWWHANRSKAIIAALIAVPTAIFILLQPNGTAALLHGLEEYVSFIAMLAALYVIAGGIVLSGDLPARPLTNTAFLAAGVVLANVIGTTGASILLIRPLLRTNGQRRHTAHVPVFFILTVSNCGGLLTPLGDPPLFLGFLKGVDFFWTFSLWRQWIFVNGLLLVLFWLWDWRAYRKERSTVLTRDERHIEPLKLRGARLNMPLLAAVVGVVLLRKIVPVFPVCDVLLFALAAISWRFTPKPLRTLNRFTWAPIAEVAILFIAIFITMVPALALLDAHGKGLGITKPWQFFWLTGGLSSVLDNAPTYLAMATLADSVGGCGGIANLTTCKPEFLAAVSCGAVFLGAGSYIGNGPNFMVKAIAEESGYRMPSFFGYSAIAMLVLVPILLALCWLMFP